MLLMVYCDKLGHLAADSHPPLPPPTLHPLSLPHPSHLKEEEQEEEECEKKDEEEEKEEKEVWGNITLGKHIDNKKK